MHLELPGRLRSRMLSLSCLFLMTVSMPLCAQNSDEDNSPLTPAELHQVLLRLLNCNVCQEQLAIYEQSISSSKELCAKAIEAEREKTSLKQKELDIALDEAELWKGLYNTIKKKKAGFGCWMGRIFSLGNYRCPK